MFECQLAAVLLWWLSGYYSVPKVEGVQIPELVGQDP